jgi:2-oxoisovalerate dehydrogenase E1 component
MLLTVTTPQELDARFRAAVAQLTPRRARPTAADAAGPASADRQAASPERAGPQVPGQDTAGRDSAGRDTAGPDTGEAGAPTATAIREALSGDQPAQRADPATPVRDGTALTGALARDLFDAQLASRHLDLAARWLRDFHEGYYTIGSAGHEGNAAVAAALRSTDPALLHYRSGGFYCARALLSNAEGGKHGGLPSAVRDVLRGVVASAQEPVAGGRHKVFGHADLEIIPTTSTIASHLPRAVGVGFAIERARRLAPDAQPWPSDAIVVCSFGDASINHASATAAFNTAGWCDHSGLKLPVLFVCEDNGLGISVPSPRGWVAESLRSKPGVRYFEADGLDVAAAYDTALAAATWVRRHRRPAVLHLRTVRLLGHAGADAEQGYRKAGEIRADLDRDPLVGTAQVLVEAGLATPDEVLARYDEIGWQVRRVAEEVLGEPKLASAADVVAPLAPRRPVRVARTVAAAGADLAPDGDAASPTAAARVRAFAGRLPEHSGPLTLAQSINAALTDALLHYPQALLFGEDVAVKGGVYGVTKGMRERFGAGRVFDTLLDETSILGLALGAGLGGLLPIPEIQYLAYLHNAEDQLRGEAASMSFFSSGAYRNPMVVRVPGLAYQEGFGGHFHNDNSVAVLRDIPGLVVACPARPDDAGALLRTCLAAAVVDGAVCAIVEPIALYHARDLHIEGDSEWLARYPAPQEWGEAHARIGQARVDVLGSGDDLTIITFGNGVRMSLRVAARMAAAGIGTRVVDLRWLSPLPVTDIIREAAATGRVLIVDETRRSGGVAEGVLGALSDAGFVGTTRRTFAVDTFVPLGAAAALVLVSEDSIIEGARALLAG